ncbi:MAG: hypothetical protein N2645_17875 [Clostridia bacterium]|nr:hypothetical protein [Clostridia bacterium]
MKLSFLKKWIISCLVFMLLFSMIPGFQSFSSSTGDQNNATSRINYKLSGYLTPDFTFSGDVSSLLKSGFKAEVSGLEGYTFTDSNGYFEINWITASGQYEVVISKASYLKRKFTVNVNSDLILSLSGSPITIWAGDIQIGGLQDGAINMSDLIEMIVSFNSAKGDSKYNSDHDINKDNAVNMSDLMIAILHFNQISESYPVVDLPQQPSTPSPTNTPVPTPLQTDNILFDDFNYTGANDSNLSAFNWSVRSGGGGPGPSGCSWSKDNISFLTDPLNAGNKILRLTATTNGTGYGTSQAEIYHQRKYLEGTYAARVRFTDEPFSGSPDGDQITQTFFTITPLNYNMDPNYSEIDFEYLPNGGWGVSGNTMWMTTWETYSGEPWIQDSKSDSINTSHAGWHLLTFTVANGEVKYYIDGALKAVHNGKYYPESLMSINFNHWYISGGFAASSSTRSYVQDVDWVYHAKNRVLSPDEVTTQIKNLRDNTITRLDSVR